VTSSNIGPRGPAFNRLGEAPSAGRGARAGAVDKQHLEKHTA
jgi:hypothetical protein